MGKMKTLGIKALGAAAILAVAAAGAYGVVGHGPSKAKASEASEKLPLATTTSTSAAPTTTTTTAPASTTAVAPLGPWPDLAQGAKGPEVLAVQQRLVELGFDPGKVDGSFGLATRYAVEGFQKLQGLSVSGVVNPEVVNALNASVEVMPLVENGSANRVEIDLSRQVMILYKEGKIRLISTISSGSGRRYCVNGACQTARTPSGAFRFLWRYSGWRESRLGKLYNPVYFTEGGIAIHGSTSVPTHPASHGCIRIPMHIAAYFPSLVAKGEEVHVVGISPATGGGPTEHITIEPPTTVPAPEETVPADTTTTLPPVAPPTSPPTSTEPVAPVGTPTSVPTTISTDPVTVTAPPRF